MTGEVLIPYIWAATGIVTLICVVVGVAWASKHSQFDEKISEQIFTEGDDERFQ